MHETAVRTIPILLSEISRTFSLAMGSQKLGQPVPESNFVEELNSALSQQMQRKIPRSCTFKSLPLYASSVSACRVISNTPDGNCFLHSSSVFTTRATFIFASRLPESENCTTVTSAGSVFAASAITCGLRNENKAAPPSAAPSPDKNRRRPKFTSLPPPSASNIAPPRLCHPAPLKTFPRIYLPLYKSGNSFRKFATLGASL